jgi:hypothetical protein
MKLRNFRCPLLWIPLALFSLPACAATLTVTNLNDSGPGSLRQAVLNASAVAGDDVIVFGSGLSGTITLTSGQIDIASNIAINGPGADKLLISGNRTSRIFYVANGVTFAINNLRLEDGDDPYGGGGIYNGRSTVTVSNCVIRGNSSGTSQGGFGGGGIANDGGTLTVSNSTLSDNSTWMDGGGIFNVNDGQLNVINSTLTGNSAQASYASHGGGIANSTRGKIIVINSTLAGNVATVGGGVSNDSSSTLVVISSTLVGNSAQTAGGGIGRGVFGYNAPHVGNTLIANNTAPTGAQCNDPVIDDGHNLDSGTTCGFGPGKGSLSNTAPSLGPLTDNGGPTATMALLPGSPALNAGDNALVPPGVTTDQRGFPRIQDGTVDIGAVESGFTGTPMPAGITGIPTLSHWALLMLGLLLAVLAAKRLALNVRC